jgi:hypothetical protein
MSSHNGYIFKRLIMWTNFKTLSDIMHIAKKRDETFKLWLHPVLSQVQQMPTRTSIKFSKWKKEI